MHLDKAVLFVRYTLSNIRNTTPVIRADGPEQTIVEVRHRHFERLVAGQDVHDAINGGGGWELLLAGYAETAGAQP